MSRWHRTRRAAVAAFRNFSLDHCTNHAAAISFFALLSIFPLILACLMLLGAVFGTDPEHIRWLAGLFARPGAEVSPKLLDSLEAAAQVRGAFVVPLGIMLLYSASQVFASLQRATRLIFRTRRKGGFVLARLRSLLLTLGTVAALVMLFAAHQGARALAAWSDPLAGRLAPFSWMTALLGRGVSVLLAFILFTSLYYLLARVRFRTRAPLLGGALVAVVWEGLKLGFGAYVASVPRFGLIYGPLATLVVFLIWIYASSCVFLLGAEFVALLNGDRRLDLTERDPGVNFPA
ncbi:MAG: YihY/virulence factor BrkB family protein [Acidobacteriota bacterium]